MLRIEIGIDGFWQLRNDKNEVVFEVHDDRVQQLRDDRFLQTSKDVISALYNCYLENKGE